MNLKLIEGCFAAKEAVEIITQMLQLKIKYHEKKMKGDANEFDFKIRERKIKQLQYDLNLLVKNLQAGDKILELNYFVLISFPDYEKEYLIY